MTSVTEGSKIFVGHRALGYVSNHIPLVTRYIHSRREHLVVTCVGRVFHTYGCAKLGLLSVSKIHPEEITAITAGMTRQEFRVWAILVNGN
jgi:U3 small nucleolar RNA-associated protein 21